MIMQKLEQKEINGLELFLESIRSEETKEKYTSYLKKYVEITGISNLLAEKDPRAIETQIIQFIIKMKKEGKVYGAIQNYITTVLSFYKIHDIVLNSKKISRFMPEQRKVKKDRSYTHEEISKLLEIADERMRVVILLLASTGMRVGAIPTLRIRNLHDMKIVVYESATEEYFTFITPECKKAIDSYVDMRKRYGEDLNKNSFLIREQFDVRDSMAIRKSKGVRRDALQWKLEDIARRSNARSKEVALAHGFRKFFTTQLVNSKVNSEIREMLLGHKIGLMSAYYRPTQDEMYAEYEKAIDNLTINEENRLRRKVEILEVEKNRMDRIELQIKEMQEDMKKK
jgi:integrase/recombinase XerD